MDSPRSYLFAGERVALAVRPHAIVLIKPSMPLLAAIALMAAFPNQLTLIILVVMALRFSWDLILWWYDRYVLTTSRVLSLSGVLTKTIVSLPLPKITDLTYSKPLVGRILGYGTLNLESAGQQDFGEIKFLPDPDHFYRAIMELALGNRPGGEPPKDPGGEYEEVPDLEGNPADNGGNPPEDGGTSENKNTDRRTIEMPVIKQSDD